MLQGEAWDRSVCRPMLGDFTLKLKESVLCSLDGVTGVADELSGGQFVYHMFS